MNQEKIGKFIAKCRKEKKLTQEEFAEKLGVNNRSVSRWENGQNMPDLSLYDPICGELGITINELLSGEKISKEDYQKSFEKNIVDVIDKVEIKNKLYHIFWNVLGGIATILILCFIGYAFYINFEFKVAYDDMKGIEISHNGTKNIDVTTHQIATMKYIITNSEDSGLIFITYYQTLETKAMNRKNIFVDQIGNSIDLTRSDGDFITYTIKLEYSYIKENYKVYYTNVSFNKIIKADSKELAEIVKESKLLYENNIQ